jgi:hypothetical protein
MSEVQYQTEAFQGHITNLVNRTLRSLLRESRL